MLMVKASMVMDFASELGRMSFGDLFDRYPSLSEAVRSKSNFAIGPCGRILSELSFGPECGKNGIPSPMTLPSV